MSNRAIQTYSNDAQDSAVCLEVTPVVVLNGIVPAVGDPHWPLGPIRVVHLDVADSADSLVQFMERAAL